MKYDLDTKLGIILGNPELKAKLEELVPQMKNHPYLAMAKGMSIRQCASLASGMITPEVLKKAEEILASF